MNKKPLYRLIAAALDAWHNCQSDYANESQQDWESKWDSYLDECEKLLPHGSGFNYAATIDRDNSKPDKLVFLGGYQIMNANGYYDGWISYKVIVTPSLVHQRSLRIVGGDEDFKEYCHEVWADSLDTEYSTEEIHQQAGNLTDQESPAHAR